MEQRGLFLLLGIFKVSKLNITYSAVQCSVKVIIPNKDSRNLNMIYIYIYIRKYFYYYEIHQNNIILKSNFIIKHRYFLTLFITMIIYI